MKFKINLSNHASHKDAATCVGWSSTEEVISVGDDHQLLSWNLSTGECSKVAQLNSELFPTDLQFLPRVSGSLGKHGDLILITSADGKFYIMNKTGRIERTIEAHKGAVLVGQWGNDGVSLLTAGEDGFIKIWSRSGMLRSVVISSDSSVYSACWSPDNQSIAYTQSKMIVVKNLAPNTKPLQWRAHEGIVSCLAWCMANDLIVSGGEDCRYRVWDSQGRQLYSSTLHDSPISSIAWSPNGDLFAVGSYNTLRLCDYSGWSRSLEKPEVGCIYKMAWSSDGIQLAAACASGNILFAHTIKRSVYYENFSATVTEQKDVTIRDISSETSEQLELPERVIQLALKYSHLVLTTPVQCYIYNTSNWNTPYIFDLKDGSVSLLVLSEKHMLLVEKSTVSLYNYQGRLIASPRWSNMKPENLRSSHVALSNDTLVVRDSSDEKMLHVVDLGSNRSMTESSTTIQHNIPVLHIALDQAGLTANRILAVLDKTRDVYIVPVRAANRSFSKLSSQIQSFQWNSDKNIIAAIQDTRLIVWYCPTASYSPILLKLCSFYYDSSELGKSPRIDSFVGDLVAVRRADGSLLNIMVSPFPALIHRYVQDNQWSNALKMCRTIDEGMLWGCLAVLSTQSGGDTLHIAEEAYAAINHYDKVFYIQHLEELPSRAQKMAGMAILGGSMANAESILLHNGMVYQAISLNMKMHNWNRALELALKHKTHIDTVLYNRQKYLVILEKDETNKKFLSLGDSVPINEEAIKHKIEMEIQKHGCL